MKSQTRFSKIGDFEAYRKIFASDPINLTIHHNLSGTESVRNFMKQNSIADYDATTARSTQSLHDSSRPTKTIRDCEPREDPKEVVESRDDAMSSSCLEEDLIVLHLSEADHEVPDEAIEIVNISFLRE
jgi:hypothetical protein